MKDEIECLNKISYDKRGSQLVTENEELKRRLGQVLKEVEDLKTRTTEIEKKSSKDVIE